MISKVTQYIKDSRAELKKVQWPSNSETRSNTILVIAVSLGVAIFLGIIDFILNSVLQKLLG